jgi:heat shock protein HtpX
VLAALIAMPTSDLRPQLSLASAAAIAIAATVHLLSLCVFLTGLIVAFRGFPNVLALIAGAVCIGTAYLLLPRPMRPPKRAVPSETFPSLKTLVDQITASLGGKPIRQIVLDEDFNASYAVTGWRRQPVLRIGLPLWIALGPQERVALIAHEVAHGVNGDSARGLVVGSALAALEEWIGLLRPSHRAVTVSELLAGRITWLLSLPLVGLQDLLFHLLWQEKQRAEYFADHLAASIAGTSAAVGLLRRSALDQHLQDVLLRHAYSNAQSGRYMLDLFRRQIDNLPAREWERMRRETEAEGATLDGSHPPTAFRIAFLQAHPTSLPKIAVENALMDAIDNELRGLEETIGGRLIQRFARD